MTLIFENVIEIAKFALSNSSNCAEYTLSVIAYANAEPEPENNAEVQYLLFYSVLFAFKNLISQTSL